MAITRPPVKQPANTAQIDAFIGAAPDASPSPEAGPKRVRKGRKVQITLTITEAMLERVDEKAAQIGQSRAAVINLAIAQVLESGISLSASE